MLATPPRPDAPGFAPVAVLHATREGHTRRIADRIADVLEARGLAVVAADVRATGAQFDLASCSGAVLAASVHMGRHEPEMVRFARKHAPALRSLPNAFVSVSMSQASAERRDATPAARAGAGEYVRRCTDRFEQDTGWHPDRVVPVAGALQYTRYNFLVRPVMKGIAKRFGNATDTTRDHDYTDWAALDRYANAFADDVIASRRADAR
jgi:menaquinone-dependent protoporphyrinogen oxidase